VDVVRALERRELVRIARGRMAITPGGIEAHRSRGESDDANAKPDNVIQFRRRKP
jgi:hypothetical protein